MTGMGRAYVGYDENGNKVYCDTPEGKRRMREETAREAAEREREMAEYYANTPPPAETLEEAISEALAAGVSREQVRAELDRWFAHGDEEMVQVLAAACLRNLACGA